MKRILVELDEEDYLFLTQFDPDRDRSASRRELVEVIEDMQEILEDGYVQTIDLDDDRVAIE